jgi:TolB-like protein
MKVVFINSNSSIKRVWVILPVLFISFSLMIILSGCATLVSIEVERPPTFNTLGIQRIAVMPYRTADNSRIQTQAATYLTSESLSRIQNTNRFTMVNSSMIEQAQRRYQNIEDLADALFSGQILYLTVHNSSERRRGKDRKGEYYYYTVYTREVTISFNYNLTLTRDGSLLGTITKTDSIISSDQTYLRLSTAEQLVRALIQRNLRYLGSDVAPYRAMEQRRFERVTSKDKIIKERAKDAMALLKDRSYRSAQEEFQRLYQETGIFEAGYNAALLIELQGNLEGALAYMRQVYYETGNPKAANAIDRIQRGIDNAGLLANYRDNQNRRDMVIARVVDEIPARIPNRSKVAVINNSRNEYELAETITNAIIHGLQSKNIEVIDRSNRNLAEAEKRYQLSGNVSDDDIVKVGNEAGINVFILVSVTGSGSSRRLSLRALDVERNTIIYQTPQTNDMNI